MQPRSQVWGFTHNATFPSVPRPDKISDDHDAGRYADTNLQKNGCIETRYRRNKLQSGPYRALRIILVSLGIPEIDENAVAHAFCDKATEAPHRISDTLLIT